MATKIFRSLSFPVAMILGLGATLASLHAQEPPQNAIIVIRHAEDAIKGVSHAEPPFAGKPDAKPAVFPWPSAAWKGVAPGWPEYPFPFVFIDGFGSPSAVSDTGFRIFTHALSGEWQTAGGTKGTDMKGGKEGPLGENQALTLAAHLDSFLKKGNFANIKRAITSDPRDEGSTPNPFDTLWPYLNLKGENSVDLYLVQRKKGNDKSPGMMAMIEKDAVLPTEGGSAIICWTGEGLEGDDGILAKLTAKYRDGKDYGWGKGYIARCADIFVFYFDAANRGVAEKWQMDDKGEFKLIEGHPSR